MKTKFTFMWLILVIALTPIPVHAQEGVFPINYRITVSRVIPGNFEGTTSVSIILQGNNRIDGAVANFQDAYLDREGGVFVQVEVRGLVENCIKLPGFGTAHTTCWTIPADVDLTPHPGTRLAMMYYPVKCQLKAVAAIPGGVWYSTAGRLEHGYCQLVVAVRGTEGAYAEIHLFAESQIRPLAYGSPHGGAGGEAFEDSPPSSARVIGLYIRSGAFVDAVKMIYDNADLPKHGGDGGGETTITFEPGEYITAIYGRSGVYLDSLSIETSMGRRFGPFGGAGGSPFEEHAPAGYEIAGFFGRSGAYIDTIGVVIRAR